MCISRLSQGEKRILKKLAPFLLTAILVVSIVPMVINIQMVKADTITVPDDYSTIQEAINNANAGDTIFVRAGTYYVDSVDVSKSVMLLGENKETTIIDGAGNYVLYPTVDNVTISGFTVRGGGWGIAIGTSNNLISDNIVVGGFMGGIMIDSGTGNVVASNEIAYTANTWSALFIEWASGNTLVGNILHDNKPNGIWLLLSPNNTLTGNVVTNQNFGWLWGSGIYLIDSGGCTLRNNILTGNAMNFGVTQSYLQDVDTSNLVDGKPIVYLVNASNLTVRADAGYVAAVDCKNITIQNLGLKNNRQGIVLYETDNTTIVGNTIENNWEGIFTVEGSSGLRVFHNNFVGNAYSCPMRVSEPWDNGYPSGGNYWGGASDQRGYNGTDLYSGPFQNETGSDGVGDTPYLDPYEMRFRIDRYPLMKSYRGLIDVGVVDLSAYPSVVRQGLGLNVSCKVVNYGIEPAIFNATFEANETTLTSFTDILVESRSSTVLEFVWNTSSVDVGNYTITVYLKTLENESDTSDNSLSVYAAVSNLVGDINSDGKVDMRDVSYVARRFLCLQSDPLWDPNADIDGDSRIDMKDIGTVARHFGEHYP